MNQSNGQQSNEFDLITEIHLNYISGLPRWEITVIESDGYSYPLDIYDNVNNAFERARIIHSSCSQPITIKIIGENGDTVAVECEKLTKLEIIAMVHTAYIYFNGKRNCWEVMASHIHSSYIIPDLQAEEDANAYANLFQALNPNCQVFNEKNMQPSDTADNTCRARFCKWNVNDSCIHLSRNTSLPVPSVDPSFETWTEHNHPIPRSCLNYSTKETIER